MPVSRATNTTGFRDADPKGDLNRAGSNHRLQGDSAHCAGPMRVAVSDHGRSGFSLRQKQETTMNHDHLNDEQLSIVNGGAHGDGTGGGTGGGGGKGTGGGGGPRR